MILPDPTYAVISSGMVLQASGRMAELHYVDTDMDKCMLMARKLVNEQARIRKHAVTKRRKEGDGYILLDVQDEARPVPILHYVIRSLQISD